MGLPELIVLLAVLSPLVFIFVFKPRPPRSLQLAQQSTAVVTAVHVGDIFYSDRYLWRVLFVNDVSALLIAENIIAEEIIGGTDILPGDITGSTLRREDTHLCRWLNTAFLDSLPKGIRPSIRAAASNAPKGQQNVFLLSVDEARTYFVNNTDRIARNAGGRARWWWLRSQGTTPGCFAAVDKSGEIHVDGLEQDNDLCGVRPAFWISLDGLRDYLQSV